MIRLILRGRRAGDAADMVRKTLTFGDLLLALAPAAHLAWVARDMPHFGHLHDDSIYFVCAKSLAEGRGYRILSLPAEPFQTKYPPRWPLALAAIWKLDPRFPENLRWGMALAWLTLSTFVALARRWFRRSGFGAGASTALGATIARSPRVIVLSVGMMSDLVFSVVLLAAILAIDSADRSAWRALFSGLQRRPISSRPRRLRRKYRAALLMFAAMLPAVATWMLWSRAHMSHGDLVSLYYTDYFRYQILNVTWHDLAVVMWKNLDGVFAGIAELLIFDLAKTPFGMHLARFLAIVVIAGTVRFARTRGMTAYYWFALMYTAILLVWHFPPNKPLSAAVVPTAAGRPGNGAGESRLRDAQRMVARYGESRSCIGHRRWTGSHRVSGRHRERSRPLPIFPASSASIARFLSAIARHLRGSAGTRPPAISTPTTTRLFTSTRAGMPSACRSHRNLFIAKIAKPCCGSSAPCPLSRASSTSAVSCSPRRTSTGTCPMPSARRCGGSWRASRK